jgi:uncharacterized protein (DUF302 family)
MKKVLMLLWLCLSAAVLHAQGDFHLFALNNKDGKMTPEAIEKTLEKNGFYISANSEMNKPFTIQFQKTDFTVFNLLTVFHKELAEQLVKKHPEAGIFVPMGIGIYQRKGDDTFHVTVLTSEAQAKILGFSDPLLKEVEKAVLASLKEAMPGATLTLSEEALKPKGPLVTSYELETDEESWEEAKDELEMLIEDGLKPYGFVMSNFTEYNYMLTKEDTVESPFDFYDTYSICKLKVIYTVSKTRPEAAAYAPCTLAVYKKKDEDRIVMSFPGVYNWMSSTRLEDKEAKAVLMKAQNDFERVLKEATE